MSEPADTPLFPLGVVLFPTQPLPLRIFEERYKLMISECLEQNAGFGVVLIKQGREVGGPASPFEIGTMAKIVDAQRFPDGRYNLQTVGETPFRLRRVTQMRPYMRGEIEPLEHVAESGEGMAPLMETVRQRFAAHIDVLKAIYGGEPPPLDLSTDDPERLSYIVANILAVRMAEKQTLLEEPSALERLKREAAMLARENKALQAMLYLRQQGKGGPESGGQGGLSDRISPN